MAIQDSPRKLTYEDYVHFPEDGRRHELIGGDHHGTPSPNTRHQHIAVNLVHHLTVFLAGRGLGRLYVAPFEVVLTSTDVVQPDLLFVADEHLDRLTEANLDGAPDLAVEIVSESTRGRDEVAKRHLYERHGVGEYWIVDPVAETVKVYRLGSDGRYQRDAELSCEKGHSLESPLFPGFSLPLNDLFG